MSEKVVYILGAGFSAPLGLPVMSNFLIKSKDMYFQNTEKYKHFLSVFGEIDKLSKIKNYCRADLFNIEEILSVIEMQQFLDGNEDKEGFTKFISEVIEYYTPTLDYCGLRNHTSNKLPTNWPMFIFNDKDKLHSFGYFTAHLIAAVFQKKIYNEEELLHVKTMKNLPTQYAVITLNYDLVLENFCTFINENYDIDKEEQFQFNTVTEAFHPEDWSCPPLAKLHGSLDTGLIVPPTWAKGNNQEITPIWNHAYKILTKANHIRIIGYSLPVADTYIKFLLKSAIIKTENLKTIDVICLDDNDGSVRKKYDEFFEYVNYRFVNANIADFLNSLYNKYKRLLPGKDRVEMNNLESTHKGFMEGAMRGVVID